ncbi:hypothetical protein BD413DRAFT_597732 [Trametes elegans]|nr:hypothetical protein BD413DRAFT_597732 [Trametes elegans]
MLEYCTNGMPASNSCTRRTARTLASRSSKRVNTATTSRSSRTAFAMLSVPTSVPPPAPGRDSSTSARPDLHGRSCTWRSVNSLPPLVSAHSTSTRTDVKSNNLFLRTRANPSNIENWLERFPASTYPAQHRPGVSPNPIIYARIAAAARLRAQRVRQSSSRSVATRTRSTSRAQRWTPPRSSSVTRGSRLSTYGPSALLSLPPPRPRASHVELSCTGARTADGHGAVRAARGQASLVRASYGGRRAAPWAASARPPARLPAQAATGQPMVPSRFSAPRSRGGSPRPIWADR